MPGIFRRIQHRVPPRRIAFGVVGVKQAPGLRRSMHPSLVLHAARRQVRFIGQVRAVPVAGKKAVAAPVISVARMILERNRKLIRERIARTRPAMVMLLPIPVTQAPTPIVRRPVARVRELEGIRFARSRALRIPPIIPGIGEQFAGILTADMEMIVALSQNVNTFAALAQNAELIVALTSEVTPVTIKNVIFDDYILGDTKEITFTAVDSAGASVDISGATNIDFALKTPNKTLTISGTPTNAPAIDFRTNGTNGQYFVRLENGDFAVADVGQGDFETSVKLSGDDTTGAIGTFRIRSTLL